MLSFFSVAYPSHFSLCSFPHNPVNRSVSTLVFYCRKTGSTTSTFITDLFFQNSTWLRLDFCLPYQLSKYKAFGLKVNIIYIYISIIDIYRPAMVDHINIPASDILTILEFVVSPKAYLVFGKRRIFNYNIPQETFYLTLFLYNAV